MSIEKLARRDFLSRFATGVHGAALASLLTRDLAVGGERAPAVWDLTPKAPHFEPKAKAVIHLFQNGGPSQVDLIDPKPALPEYACSAPSRDIVHQLEVAARVRTTLPM